MGMQDLMQDSSSLRLTFKRPKEFTIKVTKDEELGVHLALNRDADFVVIEAFQENGTLVDFNTARSTGRIRQFDCIVEVNGYRGLSAQLASVLKQEQVLTLTMRRYLSKV